MAILLPSWLPKQLRTIQPILDDIAPWRLVGGIVRDIILDSPTTDIDIAIAAPPEKVLHHLKQHRLKTVPTGLKHGTVTIYMPGDIKFEITSLRKDDRCDGRHAIVSFTNNWQEDAARRDFTMNAMYLDMEGNLYDYFAGYDHLLQRKLVFVGDPGQRIREDHLRVLRYWRFIAIMGINDIDSPSQEAAIDLFSTLNSIAGERIRMEMLKLLSAPFAREAINTMISKQITPHINLHLTQQLSSLTPDPMLNLALLLKSHPGGATPQAISNLAAGWKLSKIQHRLLNSLCLPKVLIDWGSPLSEHKKYLYLLGRTTYAQLFTMAQAEGVIPTDYITSLKNFTPPIFPLTGDDITFLSGPTVGKALAEAKKYWLEKDFTSSKDALLLYIKRIYS